WGFSTPHVPAMHGAEFFYQLLEAQTAEVFERAADKGGGEQAVIEAAAEDALPRQALSEAVQVFAAMAVEGAINLLGVMVLGEDAFIERLERKRHLDKLVAVLELSGASPERIEVLLPIAQRLADARNAFVHPKAQEGRPRFEEHEERRSDLKSAREA